MKICVQSGGIVNRVGAEKGYAWIAQAGFEGIDWNAIEHILLTDRIKQGGWRDGCLYDRPLEECIAYLDEEYDVIRENGLVVSQAHAPFPCYLPGQPELLEYMIGVYKRVIEVCQHYQVPRVVIHGIAYPLTGTEDTPERIEQLNRHLYESLIPTLKRCTGVTVCLENIFGAAGGFVTGHCTDPHEAARQIDALNDMAGRKAFGLCLDTGHLYLMHGDFRTYIPTVGDRLACLHMHDNDGNHDCHKAPLSGVIRWDHICDALKAIGYTGDLAFETFAQARDALLFDEELVVPWLTVMAKTAASFRKRIEN